MSIKDQRLHNAWNSIQLGLLLFPLLPLVGAIALLWAQFVIWRRQYRTIFRRRLNWVLIILSGWLVVMSLFAYYRRDAWLGLFNFVPFFGLFVTFSVLLQTPAQLRRLAQILVFTSVPITIAGERSGFAFLDNPDFQAQMRSRAVEISYLDTAVPSSPNTLIVPKQADLTEGKLSQFLHRPT
ncbi:hypothetical protein IQ272_26655, partial [Chroococcidiopsidales cyanobacterium LEGE 13417]|nr:hypothetical protein [Chroococcidiopsidales cyanobacterium LEGE 13417]